MINLTKKFVCVEIDKYNRRYLRPVDETSSWQNQVILGQFEGSKVKLGDIVTIQYKSNAWRGWYELTKEIA